MGNRKKPGAAHPPGGCLPAGTLLRQGQCRLQEVLWQDGESVLYRGASQPGNETVWVREFFPALLCRRQGRQVLPREGKAVLFKSLLGDFEEVAALRVEGAHFWQAREVWREGGTVYAQYLPFEGQTLEQWAAGRLPLGYQQVRRMAMPVFSALMVLHDRGVLHRGICPGGLLVDGRGELWLPFLSTAAARTLGSEIEAWVQPPFCAPEQLRPGGWQGAWTDVYALAAVLFWLLTGQPPESRGPGGEKTRVMQVAAPLSGAPAGLLNRLEAALQPDPRARTQRMEQLSAAFLQEESGQTAVFAGRRGEGPPAAEEDAPGQEDLPPPRRRGGQGWVALMAVALLAAGAGWLWWLAGQVPQKPAPSSSQEEAPPSSGEEPSSQEEQEEPLLIPDLVGQYIGTVQQNAQLMEDFRIRVVQEYNDDYPQGIVGRQSLPAGAVFPEGGMLTVYVSQGPEAVLMPDVTGQSAEVAAVRLEGMGIRCKVAVSADPSYRPGIVEKTSIAPGNTVYRNRDTVTLFVGQEQPAAGEAEE